MEIFFLTGVQYFCKSSHMHVWYPLHVCYLLRKSAWLEFLKKLHPGDPCAICRFSEQVTGVFNASK